MPPLFHRVGLLAALLVAFAGPALAAPPVPPTPAPIDALIYARQFSLNEGFEYTWCAERPTVTEGMIVVLDFDREYAHPREDLEPVLYVGDSTAQKITRGWRTGRVIALVPYVVDLTTVPIWFGRPELAERVDLFTVGRERGAAQDAGIIPLAKSEVDTALALGGTPLSVADYDALVPELRTIFETYVVPLLEPK